MEKSVIAYKIKEKGEDYYIKHLKIVTVFFPVKLTEKEIKILGNFMAFEEERARYDRFNSYYRKIVRNKLGLSPSSLSNHIRELLLKKAIKADEQGVYYINRSLFPDKENQYYKFQLQKDTSSREKKN